MLYHTHPEMEQFGLARFRCWQVLMLDTGAETDCPGPGLLRVGPASLKRTMDEMAVVIPILDERVKFLEGVLSGVPHNVDVIVVSNSSREPVDRYLIEREAIEGFGQATGRRITLVHQRDPELAQVLEEAGYEGLLDDQGLVAHGKGESMALGVLIALAQGNEYIGFLDSDNFVPGAVMEHVWNYAAGFSQLGSENICVREIWRSKPKVRDEIVFKKGGRVSRRTNRHLNRLIGSHTGFETDLIQTGNAGEHAFNADLARKMPLASGFAVETWELVWMLERWGGVQSIPTGANGTGVDVLQVETRNPHFHEEKGSDHLADMLAVSLGVLYHSPLATEEVREGIVNELSSAGWTDEVPEPRVLPAPEEGDQKRLAQWLVEKEPQLMAGKGLAPYPR